MLANVKKMHRCHFSMTRADLEVPFLSKITNHRCYCSMKYKLLNTNFMNYSGPKPKKPDFQIST